MNAPTEEDIATAILHVSGFVFVTDPMECGQDAYDISIQALEEARAVMALYAHPASAGVGEVERLTAERDALTQEVRWAINILLETIAKKFDDWSTWDIWKSEAAGTVRSFKHDLSPARAGSKPEGE
jgi:hypothetical protein